MRAKFLGIDRKEYVNQKTNRAGVEYVLQLHDGESVKLLRIPEDKANAWERKLQPMDEVEVVFGFANGTFGQHYTVVEELHPVKAKAA